MSSWFEQIFGFKERSTSATAYQEVQERLEYDPATGKLVVEGSNEFLAGKFTTPSLEELRGDVDLEAASAELAHHGPMILRQEVDDVSDLHTLIENRYSVFQAASQFNSLEHTSSRGLPEHGITCYAGDHTQGPACATACAPGTLVRNYLAFEGQGQTKERQVLNLEGVEAVLENDKHRFFNVVNGYTMAENAALRQLSEVLGKNPHLGVLVRSKLRIGVQEDTEVVCSGFGSRKYKGERMQQLVTQAYCSAVSISYSRGSAENWGPFARLILESLYEATMYVAVLNALKRPADQGARKVFLTAVGGGVFGNEMSWIKEAILKALDKFRGIGLEVVLVSYGAPTPEFTEMVAKWDGSRDAAEDGSAMAVSEGR